METVYIETTIPSYLAARASTNVIALSRKLITSRWWEEIRPGFQIYSSTVTKAECLQGDPDAAQRRLAYLEDLELLEVTEECANLASKIAKLIQLPDDCYNDAFHIAVACVNEMDYVLTWNFKHLANATLIRKLRGFISSSQYQLPQICTPEELIP